MIHIHPPPIDTYFPIIASNEDHFLSGFLSGFSIEGRLSVYIEEWPTWKAWFRSMDVTDFASQMKLT